MTEPTTEVRSLDEIQGMRSGGAPTGATRLVATADLLRRKPVAELTVEDLRLLLGQQVCPEILVPAALVLLQHDPLAEGDMYEGDLLCAVLRVDQRFWAQHPGQAEAVETIVSRAIELPGVVVRELERWRAPRCGC